MPKASAREFHQSNRPRLVNALLALRKHSRVLRHRRAFADCFGANPVASALGSSTRRDPGAADRTYHGWSQRPLKTGTFYFARKRNFLLCLDTAVKAPILRFRQWGELCEAKRVAGASSKLKTGETLARQSGGYGCAAGRGSWRWTGQKVDVRASPVGNGFRSTEASAASWRAE